MKARTIAKCRKKILSDNYIENRMYELAEKCKHWNDFYLFDCDKFYVGEEMAYINKAKYDKLGMRDKRKFEWYKKKLKQ